MISKDDDFLEFISLFFFIIWNCLIFIEMEIGCELKGMEPVDVLRLQYMSDTIFCISIYYDRYLKIIIKCYLA